MFKYSLLTLLIIFNTWSNEINTNQEHKTAYFASGCFWCVESIYENLKGVKEVNSGYSGGKTSNPTYREVMTGRTGHAEAIEVIYNPNEITFETLVNVFFGSHDPTTLNQQGPDRGTQYRSIIVYNNDEQKEIASAVTQELNESKFNNQITTTLEPLGIYQPAEEYHQQYLTKKYSFLNI